MEQFQQMSDLSGRVAVITGGAGHLGRAMASALADQGATIALVDRAAEPLAEAVEALPSGRSAAFVADLESEDARIALAASLTERFGSFSILVNNAGFVGDSKLEGWVAPFAEQSIATWRRAIEVNLTAPFHLAQLLHPMLVASGHGSIVNISSIYGILGPDLSLYGGTSMGNPAAYAASKGGLVQLTRWLATTLAPEVRVNCISPGGIERGQPQSFTEKYVARTPLKRMGQERDFVGALAFLASDASAWVTGQNIVVDGGWSAW